MYRRLDEDEKIELMMVLHELDEAGKTPGIHKTTQQKRQAIERIKMRAAGKEAEKQAVERSRARWKTTGKVGLGGVAAIGAGYGLYRGGKAALGWWRKRKARKMRAR